MTSKERVGVMRIWNAWRDLENKQYQDLLLEFTPGELLTIAHRIGASAITFQRAYYGRKNETIDWALVRRTIFRGMRILNEERTREFFDLEDLKTSDDFVFIL